MKKKPKAKSGYDQLMVDITKKIYQDVIHRAIRAKQEALTAEASATLAYHRMVCGKSVKALEKLDKELSKFVHSEDAVRELRARLQKRIRDEKTVTSELKAIGRKQAKA